MLPAKKHISISKETRLLLSFLIAVSYVSIGFSEDVQSLAILKTFSLPFLREPSGITFVGETESFIIVGDEGDIAEVSKEGKLIRSSFLPGDLEAATWFPGTRTVYVLEEKGRTVYGLDYRTLSVKSTFVLDENLPLTRKEQRGAIGWEGISIRQDGNFFISSQTSGKENAVIFTGKEKNFQRLSIQARIPDISDIAWVESTRRLLVLSDNQDMLYVLDSTASKGMYRLPGKFQEGITTDDEGLLWMTDEEGLLYMMKLP